MFQGKGLIRVLPPFLRIENVASIYLIVKIFPLMDYRASFIHDFSICY